MAPTESSFFPPGVPHRAPTDGPLPPDETAGPALLISSGILMAVALVTTVLRLYVRRRKRMLGWDDLTLFLTVVLSLARLGLQAVQVAHGGVRGGGAYEPAEYIVANMYGWYAQLLLFAAVCLLKVSICLLLLRIKNDRKLRTLIYSVMGGLVVTNGGVVIVMLTECRPIEAFWLGNGECWDPRVRIYSIYFTIAYGIITDFLCSLLPLVVIWRVRIPMKRKLLVCGLMSLGLLATGFGIGRAVSIGSATDQLTNPGAYCIAAIWANMELLLGIAAANLALARSAWAYFSGEHEHERKKQLASQSRASLTRSAYLQAEAKLRGDAFLHLPQVTIHYGGGGGNGGGGSGSGAAGSSLGGSEVDDGDYSMSEISGGREGRGPEGGDKERGGGSSSGRGVAMQKRTEFWLSEGELRRDSLAEQGGRRPGNV